MLDLKKNSKYVRNFEENEAGKEKLSLVLFSWEFQVFVGEETDFREW